MTAVLFCGSHGALAAPEGKATDVKTADVKAPDVKVPTPADMQLPPGWTMEDMQTCIAAGTPGEMHQALQEHVGVWTGTNTMWMVPGGPPMSSTITYNITSMMNGRYVKTEVAGEMPGMGMFTGMGLAGYDNVAGKFVATWVDNQSTGIMSGTGVRSADGKTYTWNYSYYCPLTKKVTGLREVQHLASPNSMKVEFFMIDPKTGKEFKGMQAELVKGS